MSTFSETEEPRSLQPREACSLGLLHCSRIDLAGGLCRAARGSRAEPSAPLQGIFLTQESNRHLLHHRRALYQLSHQGSQLTGPAGGIKEIPRLLSHSLTLSPPCYLKNNHKKTKIEGSSLLAKWGLPVYIKTAKLGWRWQQTSRRDGVFKLSTFNLIAPHSNFSQPQ